MRRVAVVLALVFLGGAVGAGKAATRDGATIVDSGSTNTPGYRIQVWSDGSATIVLQSRGSVRGTAKPFTVAPTTAREFFSDLKAVRAANVNSVPCMKSASFGTTTKISWHGWTSPDLDCPANSSVLDALVASVNKIRAASGIGTLPGVNHGGGPIRAEPSPTAS